MRLRGASQGGDPGGRDRHSVARAGQTGINNGETRREEPGPENHSVETRRVRRFQSRRLSRGHRHERTQVSLDRRFIGKLPRVLHVHRQGQIQNLRNIRDRPASQGNEGVVPLSRAYRHQEIDQRRINTIRHAVETPQGNPRITERPGERPHRLASRCSNVRDNQRLRGVESRQFNGQSFKRPVPRVYLHGR